jgi:hypothetical protein
MSGVRSIDPATRAAAAVTSPRVDASLYVQVVDFASLSINRCSSATKVAFRRLRVPKILYLRVPPTYIARPLPHGTSNRKAALSSTTSWRSLELHKHHSALGLAATPIGNPVADIAMSRPVQPVTLLRPHAARRAARFFVDNFPGRALYAVKANPSPDLLQILWDEGVTYYDVASIGEVRLLHDTLPQAVLCFMHPVKAEEALPSLFRSWREDLQPRHDRGAGEDRPRDVEGRRCWRAI